MTDILTSTLIHSWLVGYWAQMPDIVRIDRLKIFLDSMGGGAWPFLVGGVI